MFLEIETLYPHKLYMHNLKVTKKTILKKSLINLNQIREYYFFVFKVLIWQVNQTKSKSLIT